jgi:hypothetical protein
MKPESWAEVVALIRANNKYATHFTGDLFGGDRRWPQLFCAIEKDRRS